MLRKYFIFFIVLIANINLYTQVKGLSGIDTDKLLQDEMLSKFGTDKILQSEIPSMGGPINPDYYYLGPGDILSFQYISAGTQMQMLLVTPENSVIIPRIGEISVSDLSLTQAKKKIIEHIKSLNSNSIVSVTLYQPRSVMVTVKGNVLYPGNYMLPSTYKVSTAVKIANQVKNQQTIMNQSQTMIVNDEKNNFYAEAATQSGIPVSTNYSNRNITVYHYNGKATYTDIEKANILNEAFSDPYLSDGDIINVPYTPESYESVSISGEVSRPVVLPYKKGDKVSFLLKAGYNFNPNAALDNIVFYDQDRTPTKLSVDSEGNLVGSDFELKPGCAIIVGKKNVEYKKENGIVAVTGNVKAPGSYLIKENKTRLKDVIDLAGGFTSEAYLPQAYILRKNTNDRQNLGLNKDFYGRLQYSDLTFYDTTRFKWHIDYMRPFVSCDFSAAFNNNSEKDNVYLQDGDLIVVPSSMKSVFVYGQVNQPGYIPFTPNKSLLWYVEQAGGSAIDAEIDKARIIRGKNKVWHDCKNDEIVLDGDEIYVPRPSDTPAELKIQIYAAIASGIVAAATLANMFVYIFRK